MSLLDVDRLHDCFERLRPRTISRRRQARTARSAARPARRGALALSAAATRSGAAPETATSPCPCALRGARRGRRTSCLGFLSHGPGEGFKELTRYSRELLAGAYVLCDDDYNSNPTPKTPTPTNQRLGLLYTVLVVWYEHSARQLLSRQNG